VSRHSVVLICLFLRQTVSVYDPSSFTKRQRYSPFAGTQRCYSLCEFSLVELQDPEIGLATKFIYLYSLRFSVGYVPL
jgi:hypothetical protein